MCNFAKIFMKLFLINIVFISKSYALDCYMTIVKSYAWQNYNLTVAVNNAENGTKLGEVTVPQGKLWNREKFTCSLGVTLALEARFSPEIWSGDKDKVFNAIRMWKLPKNPSNPNALGWNLTVCYPKSFSDVPTPPQGNGEFECDLQAVPKFKVGG
jgi:hypothetical protein